MMNQVANYSRKNNKGDKKFMDMFSNFYGRVMNGEDPRSEEDKMLETIKTAHEDWRNAEAYFQTVTNPDLVDYAIYRVEAARTRYTYLMKQAREQGIRGNFQ